jgi:hypothetical protein
MRSLLQSTLDGKEDSEAGQPAESLRFDLSDQALMVFQLLSSDDIAHLCRKSFPADPYFGPIWKRFSEGGVGVCNVQPPDQYSIHNELLWKGMAIQGSCDYVFQAIMN